MPSLSLGAILSQLALGTSLLPCLLQGVCGEHHKCKAYPGSDDWPRKTTWKRLNEALEGRLLEPHPPGAVCHPDRPEYDKARCAIVAQDWADYQWHADNPVSMMNDQFANYTCLPNAEYACSDEGYPAYVVNATCPEHVQTAVNFARKNNVRLVIKSTGHDYLGRSNAPGSLSIWTHHLNDIKYHKGHFKLSGCGKVIKGDAFTAGAGTEMYDLYSAADKHGLAVVGGGAKSVSAGGYLTGGGHSILSSTHGLAVDQVLEMEVVTPSGNIITANEEQHSDIFWAMRGGGGSTFGVMTSVTIKAYPTPRVASVLWAAMADPEAGITKDLIKFMMGQLPNLMDSGLSGYGLATYGVDNPVQGVPGLPPVIAGFAGSGVVQNSNEADIHKIFSPVNKTISERWPGKATVVAFIQEYDSFLDWFDEHYDMTFAGNSSYIVSRLVDSDTLTADSDELIDAIDPLLNSTGSLSAFMVAGKGVQNAKPRGGSNAVNPGWRKAYIHALTSGSFPAFNQSAEQSVISMLDESAQPLRDLTPGMGAYINEALPFEPDFQHAFWGDNYERLLKIKRSEDPHDVFWCSPCVGNEHWEERDDGRLCKK